WWVAPAFVTMAVVLVPWTAWLYLSLPADAEANHWALAWAGFDVGLGLSLTATAVLVWRRSPLSEMSATVTATILVCDAWFDVLTARGWQVLQAALLAALVELPLAVFCLWIARKVDRIMEDARLYFLRA